MNSRTVKALLIISILFNIFFSIGFLHQKIRKPPAHASHFFKSEIPDLNLNNESKLKLLDLINAFKIEEAYKKELLFDKRSRIIDELAKPQPDFNNLDILLNSLNQLENELNRSFIDLLIETSLLLEEREKLATLSFISRSWLIPLQGGRYEK